MERPKYLINIAAIGAALLLSASSIQPETTESQNLEPIQQFEDSYIPPKITDETFTPKAAPLDWFDLIPIFLKVARFYLRVG